MNDQEAIDGQLRVEVVDKRIQISIGIDVLIFACIESGSNPFLHDPENMKVTDRARFARDVVNQLLDEKEDGTTCVHELLDKAVSDMIEYGATLAVDIVEGLESAT